MAVGDYLYIFGGTGTAEAVPITVVGPHSVTVTCANIHTGPWLIGSGNAGIQEALVACGGPCTVRLLAGSSKIFAPIIIPSASVTPYASYTIEGAGMNLSTLAIDSSFPLSASGVIIFSHGQAAPGPTLKDFGMVAPQPYTLTLSSFTHWPPFIYSLGVSEVHIERLYTSGAWTAVYAHGFPDNNYTSFQAIGRWTIDDSFIGNFSAGVDWDGAADSLRISKVHFWPFSNVANFPPGYSSQQFSPSVIGLKIGAAANVDVTDSWFLTGTSIAITGGADHHQGASDLQFVNDGFDVFGIIDMSQSQGGITLNISNSNWFQDPNPGNAGFTCSKPAILWGTSGPEVTISNSILYRGCPTQPLFSIQAPAGNNPAFAQAIITGNLIYDSANSASAPPIFSISGASSAYYSLNIADNHIAYENNLTYSNPMLSLTGTGVQLHFINNINSGFGSGTWLSIANDDYHIISGNSYTNNLSGTWTASLPPVNARFHGIYEDNLYSYPKSTWTQSFSATTGISGSAGDLFCNATSAQCNFNLPFITSQPGAHYTAVKTDSSGNAVCFVPAGSDKINGSASAYCTSTQWGVIKVKNDGTSNWVKY